MKKFIFLFLLVFLFALTACGSNETPSNSKSSYNHITSKKAETSTSSKKSKNLFADIYDVKVNSGGQIKVTVTYDKSHPGTPTVEVQDESICKVNNLLGNLTIKGLNYGKTKVFVRFNGEEIVINVSVEITSVEAEVSLLKYDSLTVYGILGDEIDLTPRVELNKGNLSGGTYKIVNKGTLTELENPIITINSNDPQEFIITPLYPDFDLSQYSVNVKVNVLNTYDSLNENCYRYIGRYNDTNQTKVTFENVNSGIEIAFYGSSIKFTVKNEGAAGRVKAIVDGNMSLYKYATFPSGAGSVDVEFIGLSELIHTVRIINVYEDYFNPSIILSSVQAQKFVEYVNKTECSILFIGDSITTGYTSQEEGGTHNYSNSDSTDSFAYKTQELLNADGEFLAAQGIGVRYGYRDSEYMIDLYNKYSNISKSLQYENKAHDFVVINLGTNDGAFLSKYVGANNSFENNYYILLKNILKDNPNAIIICIYGMMGANNTIKNGIINAVENVKAEEDIESIYTLFDFTSVSGRHPVESEHEAYSKTLFNFIKSLIQ